MAVENCESCKYWLKQRTKFTWSSGFKGDVPDMGKTENTDWGKCRAKSPSGNTWGWPLCHKTEWCGEWKKG